ncbi:MAG: hypothetical protein JWO89_2249, partial [Verrucomicrobiaceae bacterium]|nr:hypothetical protein [Verrucomicrobiaceae bacterium]
FLRWTLALLISGLLASCGDHQAAALKKLTGKGYSLSVSEFVRAARAGDEQAVRWFVEAGLEPSLADDQHHTALSEGVAAGHVSVVEALVASGVKLPKEGEASAELLQSALKGSSAEMVRYLIDHQVTGKGLAKNAVSPLSAAAALGQREAVELLLPLNAGREQEAFFAGAKGGDVSVLSLLLRAGANVLERQPESGKTALMLAAEAGRAQAVEMLFNAGSNRWVLDKEGHSALDLAEAGGHEKAATVLKAEPTQEELETAARPLNGANLAVNGTWVGELSSLLVFRGRREEVLPFMLDSVAEERASFHLLSGGKVLPVTLKDEVGSSGWFLSRVGTIDAKPRVDLHHRLSGTRLAMVPGMLGRSGRMVAVLEFGPAKEVYEAMPGDTFTLGGSSQTFTVDAITPLAVQLHDGAKAEEKIILSVGASR